MKALILSILVLCLIAVLPATTAAGMTQSERQQYNQDLKSLPDSDHGPPHINSTGGPDLFGYTWIDCESTGGPTYSWIDITTTGTEIAFADQLDDDDRTGPYPIDFVFPFYSYGEYEFWVQSNGLISFFPHRVQLTSVPMPASTYGAMIALFWDDLDPENGTYGSVYYDTVVFQNQNVCVVTFEDYCEHPPAPDQDTITMQVLMFEDGTIRIQYQNIDNGFDCTNCTVGIQNQAGTDGLTVIYHDASGNYPYAGYVVEFNMPEPSASISGTVYQSGGTPLSGANVRIGAGQTVSDNNGNYSITGLYPGPCRDIVWKTGYDAVSQTTTLAAGANSLSFQLAASQTVSGGFTTDFESGSQIFSSAGEWEFGTPTFDPNGAHSGSTAWSTDLDGNYETNQDDWLFSFKGFDVATGYSLRYFQWHDYVQADDGYNVHISTTAGAFWTLIYPQDGYSDPDGFWNPAGEPIYCQWGPDERIWVERYFPLDDYVNETVWIAFRHISDGYGTLSGVTIDDLKVNVGTQTPYVRLQLWPLVTSVPSYGGPVMYDAGITSTYNQVISGQAWTDLILPNGNSYGPLMVIPINVVPGYTFYGNLMQMIPAYAPPGPYVFNGYLGIRPNYIATSDNFPFMKTVVPGPDGEEIVTWEAEEWVTAETPPDVVNVAPQVPETFALHSVWPNPFNASATITVDLPVPADLQVRVFNLNGQEMALLANGQLEAGTHSINVDGSSWASGVYFVQARMGDQVAIQKMTLLK